LVAVVVASPLLLIDWPKTGSEVEETTTVRPRTAIFPTKYIFLLFIKSVAL
jgi:hypothetical protein